MIGWSAVARIVVLVAVIGGAAWWLHGTWSDDRYIEGFREGAASTHKLRDAEALALAAQIRAEAAEQARATEHANRETESRLRAQIDAARADAEARVRAAGADRARLLGRLRDAEARSAVRDSGLPEAASAEPTITISARPFYAAARRLVERAGDAEQLNVWYAQCLASH